MNLEQMIECAAMTLPEGWRVRIEVEHGAAWVKAVKPDGTDVDIDSDEHDLAGHVRLAIGLAHDENKVTP
jgi:hypothetical protein